MKHAHITHNNHHNVQNSSRYTSPDDPYIIMIIFTKDENEILGSSDPNRLEYTPTEHTHRYPTNIILLLLSS